MVPTLCPHDVYVYDHISLLILEAQMEGEKEIQEGKKPKHERLRDERNDGRKHEYTDTRT